MVKKLVLVAIIVLALLFLSGCSTQRCHFISKATGIMDDYDGRRRVLFEAAPELQFDKGQPVPFAVGVTYDVTYDLSPSGKNTMVSVKVVYP